MSAFADRLAGIQPAPGPGSSPRPVPALLLVVLHGRAHPATDDPQARDADRARPWKRRITGDLDGGFGIQMFGHVASRHSVHGGEHIRSTVDYVREGRKNNFDAPGTAGD
jgi:hypothetical protein